MDSPRPSSIASWTADAGTRHQPDRLVPSRQEIKAKVRGSQKAVVGIRTVYHCPICDR